MLDGNVEILLQGQPAALAPTLGAAITLNTKHQNFGALLAKLESYDLQAAADVVHCGLGRKESERQHTMEQVFATGLVELAPGLISFVIRLANGGKPIETKEDDDSKGPFGR